ncbi:MAG TPA: tripartite tricarboxylate transporter substrate-binding protein [Burkholderiales bacterium]|nr:tripartite tricarboxylate transporter substrate-binding protein [Burkholderiales bacterium]
MIPNDAIGCGARARALSGTRHRERYALFASAVLAAGPTLGQDYPVRPVRIVTSPAGGGNDLPSRLIARGISGPLGQQVIVDNRPAILAPEIVARAAPDGYTVLVAGSTHWVGPFIEKVSYDPLKDFVPVALVARAPVLLVVHPSMPIKSVKQLIDLAKARPGVLNSSVGAPGSSNYLGAVLFDYLAHVNITRIPYKGAAPAMTALMSGEVQVMFPSAGAATPHVQSGRLRALAVGSAKPSPLAPGLQTIAALGVPGYDSDALSAVFAPAGTPPAIVARLNQEITRYLQLAETKPLFLKAGIEAASSAPEELLAMIKAEMSTYGKVLKAAGVSPR